MIGLLEQAVKIGLWLTVAAAIAVAGEAIGGAVGTVLYIVAGMQVLGVPLVLRN